VHRQYAIPDEDVELAGRGTIVEVTARRRARGSTGLLPGNRRAIEVQFDRRSRQLVAEYGLTFRLLATVGHAGERVRSGLPAFEEFFERYNVFEIIRFGLGIRPPQWFRAFGKGFGEFLLLEGIFGLVLENFLAVRVEYPRRIQVIAVHQEVKADVSVRGVDFDQGLAFAEIIAGFGRCRCTGH
jgi:hypothetical protein